MLLIIHIFSGARKMKQNNIKIRQAQLSDLELIASIKVAGWQSAYREIVDYKYLASMSVDKQIEVIKNYSLDTIFVAENDGEVIAFCRFYEYDNPVYEDKEIDCEIREIYVKPDIKRQGIGSKLFIHTMNYFRHKGKKKLYLGVFKENHNARSFYEKMGGNVQGEEDMEVGGKIYPTVSYIFNLSNRK